MMKKFVLAAAALAMLAPLQAQVLLEEIVVTAQKREQNLQDVGIAVTAFSGEQINQLGYGNAQEVTAMAPGVSTIQPNGPSNYAIAIRGVAQNDFVSNQESPVSLYMDEVYISQMSSAGFQLFDMERVEVLRGPQGTLFGRNATGGLAHYVTKKPSQKFDAYAQLAFGEYNQVKSQGAVGAPLNDSVAFRASWATHHNSGYVENRVLGEDINNAKDYAGRAQLLIEPNTDLSVLLNARGSKQDIRTGGPFENVSSRDGDDGRGELTPHLNNYNGYRDDDGDVHAGDYDNFGHQDLESYGFTGTVKWNLNDSMTVTSITDWQTIKRDYTEDSDASDGGPLVMDDPDTEFDERADFNFFLNTDAKQFSQELRLNGEHDALRWVAGFYYLDIEVKDANGAEQPLRGIHANRMNEAMGTPLAGFVPTVPLVDLPGNVLGVDREGDGTPYGVDNPYETDTESWSVFGQVEYDFLDQFTAIVGARWIEEEKKHSYVSNFVDFQPGFKMRNGNPNILAEFGTYNGELDRGLWSAKLELDYRPTDNLLIYASWNRGVKGGGFNAPLDITDPASADSAALDLTDDLMRFDEERLDAYEIGFKSTLFNGIARLNASGYYYHYKDFQAFQIIGLSTFVFNADAENYGFEVELQASPMEGLDVLFGLGYVGIDLPVDADRELGVTKTRPVQSPKWNLNGMVRYEWPLAVAQGSVALQGDFQYRSQHYFSLTQAQASTENGYVIANARLSYTTDDDVWEAAIFVDNLFDTEYLVQTFDLATVLGMTEQYYGPPRWVGGSITYTFPGL